MSSISSFIAMRYLSSGRSNRFFSWIASLSIAGIAIGVATMIVVLSVINGFEEELRNRFLNANAHILAYRYPDGLDEPQKWIDMIKTDFKEEVTGASPFVHYETMVKHGSIMLTVLVRGFNPKLREEVQSIARSVEPKGALKYLQEEVASSEKKLPLPTTPSVIVGVGLLSLLDAKIGDLIHIISPQSGDKNDVKSFKIVGVYHAGLKHYDNRLIAMSLPAAQNFFQMGERVTGLEVGMRNPDNSPDLSNRMMDKYSLTIKEWQSFNKPLFEALKMEKAVIFLIVFLIAFVAGFNILTTLFVAVTQKQREISILKALGARNTHIVALFLKQGALFGLFGGSIGMILAFVISFAIEKYQFIDLPDPYFLTNLPVTYDWRVYVAITIVGVCICLVAGLFPALTAAKVLPSEGIRGSGKAL